MSDASLTFDNRFVRSLPGDSNTQNVSRQVFGACHSPVTPTAVSAPKLLAWSRSVAETLGLSAAIESTEVVAALGGNGVLPGMHPYAACYGGHQFGNWAGQLGDGRAITLGELVSPSGRRYDIQLKGAGPTPYSRTADGRAVLRSSVREYVCSEAMEALGVPTTRALALVGTGDDVLRDMFYDGRAAWEPGAIVCRVAPTFLRFGNAQIFTSRRDEATLRALLEFTLANIGEWDADLIGVARTAPVAPVFESRPLSSEAVVSWFAHVCTRTAEMVVEWMRVGFVHGVMNTDNMSILGLTIDYGPYGWLDVFDPTWTPNTTDAHGRRYRFGAQPAVAFWNLARFAEALVPLVDDPHELETALGAYSDTFSRRYALAMAQKLGLGELRDEDEALIDGLFERMGAVETDYTLLFRCLAKVDLGATLSESASAGDVVAPIVDAWYSPDAVGASERRAWADWLRSYARRVRDEGSGAVARRAQLERMARMNPVYVPRNYLAQEAIDALSAGDSAPLEAWFARVTRPYDEVEGGEHYAAKRPEWARHRAGCSMLSCSS